MDRPINVYMADITAGKLAFVHSVDIRGDRDESWSHGVTYLVKNYLLPAPRRRRRPARRRWPDVHER